MTSKADEAIAAPDLTLVGGTGTPRQPASTPRAERAPASPLSHPFPATIREVPGQPTYIDGVTSVTTYEQAPAVVKSPRDDTEEPYGDPEPGGNLTGVGVADPRTHDEATQSAALEALPPYPPSTWIGHPDHADLKARLDATWISRDSTAAETVAFFSESELVGGFVRAFREVRQSGLLPRIVPRQVATGAFGSVPEPENADYVAERTELEAQLAQATQKLTNYTDMVSEVSNAQARKSVVAKLESAGKEVDRAERKLRVLQQTPTASRPAEIRGYLDVIDDALSFLENCGNIVTQEQRVALKALIPVMRVRLEDDRWIGTAHVRINERPRDDGRPPAVLELGPIEWVLSEGTSIGHHLYTRERQAVPVLPVLSRTDTTRHLVELGMPAKAVDAALNGPRELLFVLLNQLDGTPLPDGVGASWRDPDLMKHIAATWSQTPYRWMGRGKHTALRPLAQAALDYLSEHDVATAHEISEAVYALEPIEVAALTRPDARVKADAPAALPVLVPVHPPTTPSRQIRSKTLLTGVRCVCGKLATIAARRYDVPRGLLCTCGRMPEAEFFGVPVDMRFPDDYLLRPPPSLCLAQLRTAFERRRANLNYNQTIILSACCASGGASTTVADIETYLRETRLLRGSCNISMTLHELKRFGFVHNPTPVGWGRVGRGSTPAHWVATPEGIQRSYEPCAISTAVK